MAQNYKLFSNQSSLTVWARSKRALRLGGSSLFCFSRFLKLLILRTKNANLLRRKRSMTMKMIKFVRKTRKKKKTYRDGPVQVQDAAGGITVSGGIEGHTALGAEAFEMDLNTNIIHEFSLFFAIFSSKSSKL